MVTLTKESALAIINDYYVYRAKNPVNTPKGASPILPSHVAKAQQYVQALAKIDAAAKKGVKGSTLNRMRNELEFSMAGGTAQEWAAKIKAEDANRRLSQKQSISLGGSGGKASPSSTSSIGGGGPGLIGFSAGKVSVSQPAPATIKETIPSPNKSSGLGGAPGVDFNEAAQTLLQKQSSERSPVVVKSAAPKSSGGIIQEAYAEPMGEASFQFGSGSLGATIGAPAPTTPTKQASENLTLLGTRDPTIDSALYSSEDRAMALGEEPKNIIKNAGTVIVGEESETVGNILTRQRQEAAIDAEQQEFVRGLRQSAITQTGVSPYVLNRSRGSAPVFSEQFSEVNFYTPPEVQKRNENILANTIQFAGSPSDIEEGRFDKKTGIGMINPYGDTRAADDIAFNKPITLGPNVRPSDLKVQRTATSFTQLLETPGVGYAAPIPIKATPSGTPYAGGYIVSGTDLIPDIPGLQKASAMTEAEAKALNRKNFLDLVSRAKSEGESEIVFNYAGGVSKKYSVDKAEQQFLADYDRLESYRYGLSETEARAQNINNIDQLISQAKESGSSIITFDYGGGKTRKISVDKAKSQFLADYASGDAPEFFTFNLSGRRSIQEALADASRTGAKTVDVVDPQGKVVKTIDVTKSGTRDVYNLAKELKGKSGYGLSYNITTVTPAEESQTVKDLRAQSQPERLFNAATAWAYNLGVQFKYLPESYVEATKQTLTPEERSSQALAGAVGSLDAAFGFGGIIVKGGLSALGVVVPEPKETETMKKVALESRPTVTSNFLSSAGRGEIKDPSTGLGLDYDIATVGGEAASWILPLKAGKLKSIPRAIESTLLTRQVVKEIKMSPDLQGVIIGVEKRAPDEVLLSLSTEPRGTTVKKSFLASDLDQITRLGQQKESILNKLSSLKAERQLVESQAFLETTPQKGRAALSKLGGLDADIAKLTGRLKNIDLAMERVSSSNIVPRNVKTTTKGSPTDALNLYRKESGLPPIENRGYLENGYLPAELDELNKVRTQKGLSPIEKGDLIRRSEVIPAESPETAVKFILGVKSGKEIKIIPFASKDVLEEFLKRPKPQTVTPKITTQTEDVFYQSRNQPSIITPYRSVAQIYGSDILRISLKPSAKILRPGDVSYKDLGISEAEFLRSPESLIRYAKQRGYSGVELGTEFDIATKKPLRTEIKLFDKNIIAKAEKIEPLETGLREFELRTGKIDLFGRAEQIKQIKSVELADLQTKLSGINEQLTGLEGQTTKSALKAKSKLLTEKEKVTKRISGTKSELASFADPNKLTEIVTESFKIKPASTGEYFKPYPDAVLIRGAGVNVDLKFLSGLGSLKRLPKNLQGATDIDAIQASQLFELANKGQLTERGVALEYDIQTIRKNRGAFGKLLRYGKTEGLPYPERTIGLFEGKIETPLETPGGYTEAGLPRGMTSFEGKTVKFSEQRVRGTPKLRDAAGNVIEEKIVTEVIFKKDPLTGKTLFDKSGNPVLDVRTGSRENVVQTGSRLFEQMGLGFVKTGTKKLRGWAGLFGNIVGRSGAGASGKARQLLEEKKPSGTISKDFAKEITGMTKREYGVTSEGVMGIGGLAGVAYGQPENIMGVGGKGEYGAPEIPQGTGGTYLFDDVTKLYKLKKGKSTTQVYEGVVMTPAGVSISSEDAIASGLFQSEAEKALTRRGKKKYLGEDYGYSVVQYPKDAQVPKMMSNFILSSDSLFGFGSGLKSIETLSEKGSGGLLKSLGVTIQTERESPLAIFTERGKSKEGLKGAGIQALIPTIDQIPDIKTETRTKPIQGTKQGFRFLQVPATVPLEVPFEGPPPPGRFGDGFKFPFDFYFPGGFGPEEYAGRKGYKRLQLLHDVNPREVLGFYDFGGSGIAFGPDVYRREAYEKKVGQSKRTRKEEEIFNNVFNLY